MVVESPQDARDVHGVDEYKGEGGKQPIRTVHAKTAQHTYRNAVGLTAVRETKVVVHFKVVHRGKRGFERCAPNHALYASKSPWPTAAAVLCHPSAKPGAHRASHLNTGAKAYD